MATTCIRGETQIMPATVDLSRLFDPFLTATEGDWDITGGNPSYTITGVRDPTAAQDVATKAYVDAQQVGLAWKDPARACTVGNVDISSDLEPGDTVDGVTLAEGDRVLVKDQTNAASDETQSIDISGAPTGGTWTLQLQISGYGQQDVTGLAHNVTAAALETAIDGVLNGVVAGWTNGDISVSGSDILGTLTLTYNDGAAASGSLASKNHPQPTADLSGLTGGTPAFGSINNVEGGAAGSENGVYVVQAAGAALRASDWPANQGAANFALFVQEGTTCGDKAFTVTNNSPDDVIDSDGLTFVQFAGAGQIPPTHVYNDVLTVTNGSPTVTVTTFPITAGTERVYLNGIRQAEGGSNDYTINPTTGVITFNFNLVNSPGKLDTVYVDYQLP